MCAGAGSTAAVRTRTVTLGLVPRVRAQGAALRWGHAEAGFGPISMLADIDLVDIGAGPASGLV